MKAIILAAGKGTRLLPITTNRPKHLLEVGGKPILKRIIDDLLSYSIIEEVIIVIHYQRELIIDKVNQWYDQDLIDEKIQFIHQHTPRGTGDALKQVISEIKISNSFMLIYGDLIYNNGVKLLLENYVNNVDIGYILTTRVENSKNFGVLEVYENKLISIIEKPEKSIPNSLINAGIFIFPTTIIDVLDDLTSSIRKEIELTEAVQKLLEKKAIIEIVILHEGWFDIGFPWHLLNANEHLLKTEKTNFTKEGIIEEGVYIIGDVHIGKNTRIRSGSYIEGPVFIDDNADIGPNCYIRGHSYIGKNVRIGNACEVKNSIIYSGTHAGHLSYIGDSVIGERCNFGAGTITANLRHDGKNIKVNRNKRRIDSKRRKIGVIMGDQVKTGIGVNILPGVVISSNTWINAGELISRDIT